MKIQKLTALLAAVILLTAAGAKEGRKEAKQEPSNTRIASCLVKITCDPAFLPLRNLETIDQLLHGSGVYGKAIREILGIAVLTDETEELVRFGIGTISADEPERKKEETGPPSEYIPPMVPPRGPSAAPLTPTFAAEQTLFFQLAVKLEHDVKPAAEEFMNALIDNLRKTLDAAFRDYSKRFRQQLEFAENDVRHAEADLVGTQEKLRQILGSYNLEREAILDDMRSFRRELRDMDMEFEGNEAFIEATSKRIAETEDKIANKIALDPVLAELQKIVKIHEERITKLGNKGAPEPETSDARENLLRARIELAEHREEIRQSAGAELINKLRNQISELTIRQAQALKRMDHFRMQLSTAEHLLEKADEYELFSLKVKIAKQTLEEALIQHSRMKRKIPLIPPSVVVFGAD